MPNLVTMSGLLVPDLLPQKLILTYVREGVRNGAVQRDRI